MLEWIDRFLAVRGLAPHGYCLLWEPELVWSHVAADAVIAAAYFSIPFILWRLLRMRQDIEFGWMLGLFAVFILACGMTHVMGIVTLWVPAYGWEALIKIVTAVASLWTAVLLVPLLPRLVAIPSPAALQEANAALVRAAEERERTEAMLRQAQKLEAIGQLTGGVAHDFNNLLGVVLGNLDRAKRKGTDNAAGRKAIEQAIAASERGARLVEQLLAFARQQPLEPRPLDLNAVVGDACDLLRQTIGSHISVECDLAAALPLTVADRSQIENAIVNLGINARDAMPEGGTLTISTRLGTAKGVEVAVSDTGEGMDAETLARAADPFFTTKPVGKGSGLGLSQVYGTVEQHGGSVEIVSTPGTGTTVRMFLPVDSVVDGFDGSNGTAG